MISLVFTNSAIFVLIVVVILTARNRLRSDKLKHKWFINATILSLLSTLAFMNLPSTGQMPLGLSDETRSLVLGLFLTSLTLWVAILAFWVVSALAGKWEKKARSASPMRRDRTYQEWLVDRVDEIQKYRRHSRGLFYVVWVLALMFVFTFASWPQWWADVSRSDRRDPTSFFVLYVAALSAQILGVVLTIFLYRKIKAQRIETPLDMFKVFQEGVLEAVNGRDVVIHHIAPFPGLFELLHESIHFPPGEISVEPRGKWKRYLDLFSKFNKNHPPLTLAMVRYWKCEDGTRV